MLLTPNFHLEEFTRTATGLPNVPSGAERAALQALATHVLQPLRDSIGKPVYITSGFRSAAVNRAVGGVAGSQHRSGQAADILVAMNWPDASSRCNFRSTSSSKNSVSGCMCPMFRNPGDNN